MPGLKQYWGRRAGVAHPPPSAPPSSRLLDERSDPDFRRLFGELTREACELQVALTRVRLSGVDLRDRELRSVRAIRLLLGEVNAVVLGAEAAAIQADPGRRANLEVLVRLFREERLEVRSAPLAGWSPDFTVFNGQQGPRSVLVGPHWFSRPFPYRGPAFASLHGPRAARRASVRFEELWKEGHDIGTAVGHILERASRREPRGDAAPA